MLFQDPGNNGQAKTDPFSSCGEKWIKDIFIGVDRDGMMVLPKNEFYVNVHEHCFHVWSMPQEWNML